jgi:hypothetical protein
MAYDDLKDPDYAETRVKKSGKSKGRKGNVAPKTYAVPNLIVEGDYSNVKAPSAAKQGNGKGNQYTKTKYKSGSSAVQGEGPGPVKYQAPKNVGAMSISDLGGQYTGVPKSGGK